jgi:ADP-heptose:LPS heptosyltransferase
MRQQEKLSAPKIVVSVWPGIGDIIFTTPVFRELRRKFPDSWITALVWSSGGTEILSPNPHIDEVVESSFMETRSLVSKFKGYDIGVQCSHPVQYLFFLSRIKKRVSFNGNPFWWLYPVSSNDFHSTEYYLQAVDKIDGVKLRNGTPKWEIFLSKDDEVVARDILKSLHSPVVAIHPGARNNKNKRWATRKFAKLCDSLQAEFRTTILLVGGNDDQKECRHITTHTKATVVNCAGSLSLLQSAAVIKGCDLFIGHASGPTYIAAAVGTPVVAIHGPDDPKNFGPLGDEVKVVSPELSCAPCLHFYRNFLWGLRVRYIPVCPAMRTITVDQVFDACSELLGKS